MSQYRRSGDPDVLRIAEHTLQQMAAGGIYDQIGGGFHRYSVDRIWLVPHFEKMLYDNAQLLRAYLHAWQINGRPEHRRIIDETVDYVLREMTAPQGGFYSAQDADSEGEEGKFFVWTAEEIEAILGKEEADLLGANLRCCADGQLRRQDDPEPQTHRRRCGAAGRRARGDRCRTAGRGPAEAVHGAGKTDQTGPR